MIKIKLLLCFIIINMLSACSVFDWLVYKPDMPQGNYIEQRQVDKLRRNMTMEQVQYLIGLPVVNDSYASNVWYYIYHYKSGRNAKVTHKELIVEFDTNNRVSRITGDYKLNPNFATPLEDSEVQINTNPVDDVPLIPEQRPDAKDLIQETTGGQKKSGSTN